MYRHVVGNYVGGMDVGFPCGCATFQSALLGVSAIYSKLRLALQRLLNSMIRIRLARLGT